MKTLVSKLFMVMITCMTSITLMGQAIVPIYGDQVVCRGDEEGYYVTQSPGITYNWNVTNGTITSNANDTITVLWDGSSHTGQISVTGTDPNFQLAEEGDLSVEIENQPFLTSNVNVGCASQVPPPDQPPSDSTDCMKVCDGSEVVIYSNTNSNSVHNWSVTGGTITANYDTAVVVQWNGVGYGTISVSTLTNGGCNSDDTRCVEVIPSPTAKFSLVPNDPDDRLVTVCRNNEIQFQDLSTTNGGSSIISWQWDFGDGNSSNQQSPSHIYTSTGTYEVKLIVENECHCKSEKVLNVRVLEAEPVEVSCPAVVCENQEVSYEANGSCSVYDWEVMGGVFTTPNTATSSVKIKWNDVGEDGFGYVMVYDNHCGPCEGPTVVKVPVIKSEVEIDGPSQICKGSKYLYKLPRWPATEFEWSIEGSGMIFNSDQPNEIVVYANDTGTSTLRCVYKNDLVNCGGKASMQMTVLPVAEISGPVQACSDSTYDFQLNNGFSGDWSLYSSGGLVNSGTGGTFNTGFPAPGDYILEVEGTDFCSPDPFQIEVVDKPDKPDFFDGPDTICLNVPFSYKVYNSLGGTTFNWKIEGGTFSGGLSETSGRGVSATFSGSGPYRLKAWRKYKSGLGCVSDTLAKTVYLENVDPAITGTDTACDNTTSAYYAAYPDGETYEWSIIPETMGSVASGNGTRNVTVMWNSASSAQYVDLVAKVRKCGVSYYDTLSVFISDISNISISAPSRVCEGENVGFSISSSIPINTLSSVEWDFGDGSTETTYGTTTSYVYDDIGSQAVTYTVSATVHQPNGCNTSIDAQHTVVVEPSPVANISPSGPIHICDSLSPISDTLYALVQSGIGATAGYEWFKNGVSTPITTPKFYYTGTGQYYCVVTGNNGCTDTTNTVVVDFDCGGGGSPNGCIQCASYVSDTVNTNMSSTVTGCGEVQINVNHNVPGARVMGENWAIDGDYLTFNNSSGQATYTFDKAGQYRVFYELCFSIDKVAPIEPDSICQKLDTIDIINPYMPGIKYNMKCSSGGVYRLEIIDHSEHHPNTPITNYRFYLDTGSGLNQVQNGASTNYNTTLSPGNYPVRLRIEGGGYPPCNLYDTIELPAFPVADFSFNFDGACMGYPIEFTNLSSPGTGLSYEWDFGDFSSSTIKNPSRAFASFKQGGYQVSLTVRNDLGCEDVVTKTVNVSENKLDFDLNTTPDPAIVCANGTVTLSADLDPLSTIPEEYIWQPDSFAVLTHPNNSTTVLESGSYFVTLKDSNECISHSNSVAVEFVPAPDVLIEGPTDVCAGDSIRLYGTAGDAGQVSYQWKRNGVVIGNDPNISVPAGGGGTQNFELQVTLNNPITCVSYYFHTVEVHPTPAPPVANFHILTCNPYSIELEGSAGSPGTFTWSDGQSGSPVTVNKGGEYTLTFTDQWGCSSQTTFYVPQSPEEFIWIYPLGCYELCSLQVDGLETWQLPDPIIQFDQWSLNTAGGTPINPNGTRSIPDIYIPAPFDGEYSFTLDNGYCDYTAGIMELSEEECDCDFEVLPEPVIYDNSSQGCKNTVDVFITNNSGQSITVSLHAANGILIPSTVTVPPGGGNYNLEYIPDPGVAPGSIDELRATATVDGGPCYAENELQLPNPLCGNGSWRKRASARSGGNDAEAAEQSALFDLAPNPARDEVQVMLELPAWDEQSKGVIEVYDLRGARIYDTALQFGTGTQTLVTKNWRPSMYIVVLRVNGEVRGYKRLVIR